MKVGFIGVGIMGKPMVRNIINKGYETYLFDVNKAAISELEKDGGFGCESVKEISERSDILFTMLPATIHVQEVLFSDEGVARSAKPGTIVIDMSSVSYDDSKSFSEGLKEFGISFLDAPVSGGEPMAIEGTLSIMVGGNDEEFNKVLPLFQCMGTNVVHVGECGAGSIAKLANQIIVSIHLAALSEAAVFASKAGIDLNKLYQAIRRGLAGSAVMDAKMSKIIERDFKPGGRIEINFKDLNNVKATAATFGVPLPITTQVREIFSSQVANGNAMKDHSHIIDFFEGMANYQIPKALSYK